VAIIYGKADSEVRLLKKYPGDIQRIEDINRAYEKTKAEFETHDNRGIINKIKKWWKKKQLDKFDNYYRDPLYRGARGEINTLNTLAKLSDEYRVLCDVQMRLPGYSVYRGKSNLRSAQADFVVVSKRGFILIEVKNWSNYYYRNLSNFSPHEQTDRARVVMETLLRRRTKIKNVQVHGVLLAVQKNMQYNKRYSQVSVVNLSEINHLLECGREELSDSDVKTAVKFLRKMSR